MRDHDRKFTDSFDKTVQFDATGRAAAAAIKPSQLIEYSGAPHGVLASHTQRVIDEMLAFIRSERAFSETARRGASA